ncbi:MAG: hypothetical protein ACJ74W_09420 [Pyrinomonadaceae bacterium]
MLSDKQLNEPHLLVDEERQSPFIKLGAIVCALAVTGALLAGYFVLQHRHKQSALAAQRAAEAAKKSPPIEAQVFENEALLQGGDAVVGGIVRNISNARIDELSVEIQLIPRAGEKLKVQQVKLEPANLNPGEEGRYSLTVPSRQWSATRLVRLLSGARQTELAFKSQLGERRPLEGPPQGAKIVIVPDRKGKRDDFLNTPDNPIAIH